MQQFTVSRSSAAEELKGTRFGSSWDWRLADHTTPILWETCRTGPCQCTRISGKLVVSKYDLNKDTDPRNPTVFDSEFSAAYEPKVSILGHHLAHGDIGRLPEQEDRLDAPTLRFQTSCWRWAYVQAKMTRWMSYKHREVGVDIVICGKVNEG